MPKSQLTSCIKDLDGNIIYESDKCAFNDELVQQCIRKNISLKNASLAYATLLRVQTLWKADLEGADLSYAWITGLNSKYPNKFMASILRAGNLEGTEVWNPDLKKIGKEFQSEFVLRGGIFKPHSHGY